jgi:hypothetical protein
MLILGEGLRICSGLALPMRIDKCSLASLQHRLVKPRGRIIEHARYYWLLLAESRRRTGYYDSALG